MVLDLMPPPGRVSRRDELVAPDIGRMLLCIRSHCHGGGSLLPDSKAGPDRAVDLSARHSRFGAFAADGQSRRFLCCRPLWMVREAPMKIGLYSVTYRGVWYRG